ncbi:MAG: oligosaccharide flippase family protein [Candidatus Tyrphobacter sp.]
MAGTTRLRIQEPVRYYQGLFRQGAIVFAGSAILGACGFVFQMIASRRLGVEAYGTFYTLLSVVIIAGMPGALVGPVIARYCAECRALHDEAHVRGLMTDLIRWILVAAVIYMALSIALALPLGAYLHVPAWTLPVAGIIAAIALASNLLRAVVQGSQAFSSYAVSAASEGVAKVVALIALIAAGLSLVGGLVGYSVGVVFGLLTVAWLLERQHAGVAPVRIRYDWRRIALSAGGAASITIATTLIGTVDVIIVKHFFEPYAAGLYAAAALAGKVLMFLVGFVPIVLLPRVTDHHARGEQTRGALLAGVMVLVGVALAGGIGLQCCGSAFLQLLVGHRFAAAASLLLPYAMAMVALGLTNVLAYYGIATHRLAFAVPLVAGATLTLVAVTLMHSSLAVVVQVLLIGNVVTCAAVAAAVARGRRADSSRAATQ